MRAWVCCREYCHAHSRRPGGAGLDFFAGVADNWFEAGKAWIQEQR